MSNVVSLKLRGNNLKKKTPPKQGKCHKDIHFHLTIVYHVSFCLTWRPWHQLKFLGVELWLLFVGVLYSS